MACLEDGFEDAMTVMVLPKGMRRFFRTSNHNETALMRLMESTLIELNEKRQAGKAVFSHQSYEEMMKSDTSAELKRAAIRQINMAAA